MMQQLLQDQTILKQLKNETALSVKELQHEIEVAIKALEDLQDSLTRYNKGLALQDPEAREELEAQCASCWDQEPQDCDRVDGADPASGQGQRGIADAGYGARDCRESDYCGEVRGVYAATRFDAGWNAGCAVALSYDRISACCNRIPTVCSTRKRKTRL
jgi:hypothetical protein